MQSAAAACICNLAANLNSKEIIATSGALEVLVDVLQSENQAAAAQVSYSPTCTHTHTHTCIHEHANTHTSMPSESLALTSCNAQKIKPTAACYAKEEVFSCKQMLVSP
jgi:hypothetical protein